MMLKGNKNRKNSSQRGYGHAWRKTATKDGGFGNRKLL